MALLRRGSRTTAADGEPSVEDPDADYTPADTQATEATQSVDAGLPPSRMRGSEWLYGLVVGLELVVIAIVNLTDHTGKGAPAHPATTLEVVGLIAALAFIGLIWTRHRTVVGIGAIIAAIVVTAPKTPDSLALGHILGLIFPFVYGMVLTQRQRKAMLASGRRGRNRGGADTGQGAAAGDRSGRSRGDDGRSTRTGRRRKSKTPEPTTGPRPSARYTPPKAKRPNKGRVAGR
jgi:hypothetical protein